MSLELASTLASIGTFIVITATAAAAIVQLRHLRSSNQIAGLTECCEVIASQRFFAARRYIEAELPELLKRPDFPVRFKARVLDDEFEPLQFAANFFENMGAFVKYGIIDKDIACDLRGGAVLRSWQVLLPAVRMRREVVSPALWENFEYLAVLCEDLNVKHPAGTYPRSLRRMRATRSCSAALLSAASPR